MNAKQPPQQSSYGLRILVDPSVFHYGRCGLTRYYAALCEGLADEGVQIDLPLLLSNNDYQPGFCRWTKYLRGLPILPRLLNHGTRLLFQRAVRQGRSDWLLVTSPVFDRSFYDLNQNTRAVMVVHDLMTCVVAPDGLYDSVGPALPALLTLAARAEKVICISNDTRTALQRTGVIDPARMAVVTTGNLLASSHPAERFVPLPKQYLLFVGERSGRKGFYTLIRALQIVLENTPNLQLVCTGTLRPDEIDLINRMGLRGHVQSVLADDGVLVHLYRNAFCLVYPSLYEGFGLPVIEAMHYGCPVITSNYGALSEVAADAALIVDPKDPGDIAAKIVMLLSDANLSTEYRVRGKKNAARFEYAAMIAQFRAELMQEFDCE